MGEKIALIDNDYIQHLMQINLENEELWLNLIQRLFSALGYKIKIHELVYKNELMDKGTSENMKKKSRNLVNNEIVTIACVEEIRTDYMQKMYYEMIFEEICRYILGEMPVGNVWTEWRRKSSLGEIHSLSMCATLGYDLFLSDDSDSKEIMRFIDEKFVDQNIKVFNRNDSMELALESNGTSFSKNERRLIKKRW